MTSEPSDDDSTDTANPDGFTSTLSGIGHWIGLVDTSLAVQEYADQELDTDADQIQLVEEQLDRYCWFLEQIGDIRSLDEYQAILDDPPRQPGAWQLALVELSLVSSTTALFLLENWTPPSDDPSAAIFHQICLLEAKRRQ